MERNGERAVLITGGAGFIGSNLAQRLLSTPGLRVRILDNFSRRGVERNVAWLRSLAAGKQLEIIKGDVRDVRTVRQAARGVAQIYHLAAQVAVTTSVEDPETDFEVNVRGTLNVLEAARASEEKPFVLFTSTNKVYGSLERLAVEVNGTHYSATDKDFRGVTESEPLDFHSPYGCSKGAADQYVRDYSRIYDLPTVVFRMSCIAGPRQFGNEDQGWVAHFLYSVLAGRPITIYGDGYQVRDVLHVQDLIDAMIAAGQGLKHTRGQVYNLGGGMERSVSVIEMLRAIEKKTKRPLRLEYSEVRPGDQPLYIADTTKLESDTGWRPRRSLDETLDAIHRFWKENRVDALHSEEHRSAGNLIEEEVA
ncbi:GDP-mannose 4,6-dehydratase [Edaphobacter sp. HDX4]|uniref:GDP-mannose 4,6-dehydratase n=1 Tax=Edaphobacter sp. HDX4 TaxID=2794064 RepID=UPI002FE57E91